MEPSAISDSHWLVPGEQELVCEALVHYGLVKWDNQRQLPLKSGGKTDVYINLREARNKPEAIEFLAHVFANPLGRLEPDRFVEVPDSVSCFAGPLAVKTGLPYITIREQTKEGRVSRPRVIGEAHPGEAVCMVDDVIT